VQEMRANPSIRSAYPPGDQDNMAARINKPRLSVHPAFKTHSRFPGHGICGYF